MAGKALAIEGVWWLGEEIVQKAAGIPGTAVPASWSDQAREALERDVPVGVTQLSAFVAGLRDRWGR